MFFNYIDPGSGYIIVQIIIAAFASILLFFKKIKAKIMSFLNFFRKKKSN